MIDNERQSDDDGEQDQPPTDEKMHGRQRIPGGANARGDPDRPGAPKEDRLPAYERWTRERLYAHARTVGIKRRSSMNKQQLIDALRERCR